MLSVNYAEYRKQALYAECRYAECLYAICCGAQSSVTPTTLAFALSFSLASMETLDWQNCQQMKCHTLRSN
jgi:hypothetical protein